MKIIAEVGSNVKNLDDCILSIKRAKSYGADAVKFQYFTSKEMYGIDGVCKESINKAWLNILKNTCDNEKIEFMCTFFSPDMLKYALEKNYIDTIKIASSDMEYLELIDIAKASGKDIYLSTGGHTSDEISSIVKYIGWDNDRLTLFYCESEYPTYSTDFSKLDLEPFRSFDKIGLSDHSKEIYSIPRDSMYHGVSVIEKHVNFCGYSDTPDAPHSLDGMSFAKMVDALKGFSQDEFLSPGENMMRLRYNRRLIATEKINEGDILRYGNNYGCYRSIRDNVDGISPYYYDKVNGLVSEKQYKPGDVITIEYLRGL